MTFRSRARRLLADRGVEVSRRRSLRFGVDELLDVGRLLPRVDVVLDVGANDGRTSIACARAFRAARIYAFEPVPSTFALLTKTTAHEPRIECFDVALGAEESTTTIELAAKSGHNSLLNAAPPGPDAVVVTVTTGDAWMSSHGLRSVDLLKIDTEGYELHVLDGFTELLRGSNVECVLAECEFERVTKEPHTSFFDLYDRLVAHGMSLVTLYTDAVWSRRFARGNALFVRTGS